MAQAFSAYLLFFNVGVALAALPQVDFDRMGRVGIAGAFSGFDLFDNSSIAYDPQSSTIFSRSSDGALDRLEASNDGGIITSGCALGDAYFFAGSFSSIGSLSAANVVSYTSSSHEFKALASNGPNGQVDALYCDADGNKLWAGGNFTSPGKGVAVYDVKAGSWSQAPFVGVTGASGRVFSITANSSQASLFFAGSFITTFQGNGSSINGTNNPNVPFSSGASPFSSSLVPVPLGNAEVDASPSSTDSQFSDIQSILCPGGDDGPGNTWLAADGNTAVITIRKFSDLTAHGVRLGNTFIDGHGTTGFSVTTIPDNDVQTLTYVDAAGQNQTCSDPCPLSSDSSILYQDFLFNSPQSITGVQIKLSEWSGSSAGLHILQLLSSGAFASATDDANGQSCYAPAASETSRTGNWEAVVANTGIAGTTQTVLTARVDTGTSPSEGPSFTWHPYVSASGEYDVSILVPGCSNFQDCALRTSVSVTLFPGGGLDPIVQTISQTNTEDETRNIYSGPIVPSSDTFVTTLSMRLADNPEGKGQNGQYVLVADRVQLVLTSANVTSGGGSGNNNGSSSTRGSFGFFEYPLANQNIDATRLLSNSSQTAADLIGLSLFQGLGGNSSLDSATGAALTTVAHHSSGRIIVGGNFARSGSENILIYNSGSISSPAGGGLNGAVSSLLLDGDRLYVGGEFTDTSSSSMNGKLRGVAVYDINQDQWSSLGGGLNGNVSALGLLKSQIQVAGNFSQVMDSDDNASPVSGLAVWDIASSSWRGSGGFLVGSMSFVANGTDDSQFIAGSVISSSKYGSSGLVMLENGDGDSPQVSPLNVQLGSSVTGGSTATHAATAKRSVHAKKSTAWFPKRWNVWARQSSGDLAALPPAPSTPAPAVLAGAFWKNGSADGLEIVIIGGNFSFKASGADHQGLALYDQDSGSLTGLTGANINGTVRSLLVDGDSLYMGGEFSVPGQNLSGFAVYDLAGQQWVTGVESLQGTGGSDIVIRSVTKSASQDNAIIVAGTFSRGGSLSCPSICQFDPSSKRWNNLGSGITGEVATVAYAGNNQNILMAAGSLALSGSDAAYVLQYSFENSTWTPVGASGNLPGPVTALEVNNGNTGSVFAAGKSSTGSSFLAYYRDGSWTTLDSLLEDSSVVSQLAMVPLREDHDVQGVIEADRMLLVSGSLDSSDFQASSALFDGEKLIPYITSTTSSGSVGVIAALFRSLSTFSFEHRKFFATGVVILISIAIAAGVVFLLALIGILWTLFSRSDDKLNKMDPVMDDDDDSVQHRPSSLLEHINAATRTTIIGNSPFAAAAAGYERDDEREKHGEHGDPFGPDASNYLRAETPSDVMGGMLGDEMSRPAHARYSFDGAGEGELPLVAGAEVEILDDRDAAWWYARDVRTGQEGVVPASYMY